MPLEKNTESAIAAADAGNSEVTLEQALAKAAASESKFLEVVADRDKVKGKLRKLEETASSATELQAKYDALFAEKGKLLETYESTTKELSSLKQQALDQKVNTALETAITAAGAKSVSTVLKLINKSDIQFDKDGNIVAESIEKVVKSVSESDPILFGEVGVQTQKPGFIDPGVKRAGTAEGTETSYAKELKTAKNQREISEIMNKYGVRAH